MSINEPTKGPPNCIFRQNCVITVRPIKQNTQYTVKYDNQAEQSWQHIRAMLGYTIPNEEEDTDYGEKKALPKNLKEITQKWQTIANSMKEKYTNFATSTREQKAELESDRIMYLNKTATHVQISIPTDSNIYTLEATQTIKQGVKIGEYHGQYITDEQRQDRKNRDTHSGYLIEVQTKQGQKWVDATDPRTATAMRWCGRSSNTKVINVTTKSVNGIIIISAIRDIEEGESIIRQDDTTDIQRDTSEIAIKLKKGQKKKPMKQLTLAGAWNTFKWGGGTMTKDAPKRKRKQEQTIDTETEYVGENNRGTKQNKTKKIIGLGLQTIQEEEEEEKLKNEEMDEDLRMEEELQAEAELQAEQQAQTEIEWQLDAQQQDNKSGKWDNAWQAIKTNMKSTKNRTAKEMEIILTLKAIQQAAEEQEKQTETYSTPTIQTICHDRLHMYQQHYLTMLTAQAGDIWRSDNEVEQSLGALKQDDIDFLKNNYTWLHPCGKQTANEIVEMAIQTCLHSNQDTRLVTILDKTKAVNIKKKYEKNSHKHIKLGIVAFFPENTIEIIKHKWDKGEQHTTNHTPMALMIIEIGPTIPIDWKDLNEAIVTEIKEAEIQVIPSLPWPHRNQPYARAHKRKRQKEHPGIEFTRPLGPISSHMTKDDMAHCTLKLLGIHEPPLKKRLMKAGHSEDTTTSEITKQISETTLKALMKAFDRNREYVWRQKRSHSFQQGNKTKKRRITRDEVNKNAEGVDPPPPEMPPPPGLPPEPG